MATHLDQKTDNKIKESIQSAYGALDQPNFGFVSEAIRRRPYEAFVKQLKQKFTVTETTDPNDDVAFCYQCSTGSGEAYGLQLSMVGPYGILYGDNYRPIVTSENPELRDLLNLLQKAGINLINQDLLEEELEIQFQENPNPTIFSALFSPIEIFPWKASQ